MDPLSEHILDRRIERLRREQRSLRAIALEVGEAETFVAVRLDVISASLPADNPLPPLRRTRWTETELVEAVLESQSLTECLARIGLSPRAAGNRTMVAKRIRDLGLDTGHWTKKGPNSHRKIPLDDIMIEGSTYSTGHLRKRLISEGVKEHRCESCDLREWRGEPIPLELDHVNGVPTDHRIENLRLLCPNCHALTPTWRGRNVAIPKRRRWDCCDCGKSASRGAARCDACSRQHQPWAVPKIDWPDSESLSAEVREIGAEAVGRRLGVSGTSVRKRIKKVRLGGVGVTYKPGDVAQLVRASP